MVWCFCEHVRVKGLGFGVYGTFASMSGFGFRV